MITKHGFVAFTAFLMSGFGMATAEAGPIVRAELRAKTRTEVAVSDLASTKRIDFYLRDKGNLSKVYFLRGDFPLGATISTAIKPLAAGASAEAQAADAANWLSLGIRNAAGRERDSLTVRIDPQLQQSLQQFSSVVPGMGGGIPGIGAASTTAPSCLWLQNNDLWSLYEELQPYLDSHPRGPFTEEQKCGWIYEQVQGRNAGTYPGDKGPVQGVPPNDPTIGGPTGPGPGGNLGIIGLGTNYATVTASGIVHKDTCAWRPKSEQLIRVTVDLSAVDPSLFPGGVTVAAELDAPVFRGSRASSIKPVSEGRFAPQPIGLMSTVGYGTDQRVDVYRYRGVRQELIRSIPVADFVFWRRWVLARFPVSGILNGGRAVFEYTNDNAAYSVCFRLARRRQRANGYAD